MKISSLVRYIALVPLHTTHLNTDPSHTRDPSGCTAVAALITHDNKIYVVQQFFLFHHPFANGCVTGKCWRFPVCP
jgi:hypothetical protein